MVETETERLTWQEREIRDKITDEFTATFVRLAREDAHDRSR